MITILLILTVVPIAWMVWWKAIPFHATIAFSFWSLFVLRNALAYLFFRSDPIYATAISSLYVFAFPVVFIFPRDHPRLRKLSIPWPVWAYIAWTGLSLFWTEAESLFAAFGYWLSFVYGVLVAKNILERAPDIEKAVSDSIKGFVVGTIALCPCALFAGLTPEYRLGDQQLLHPNMLGNFFAIAAILSLYLFKNEGKKRWLWIAAVLGGFLTATISKASIVSAVVALMIFAPFSLKSKLKAVAIAVPCLLLFIGLYARYFEYYSDTGQMENIAGRFGDLGIWADAVDKSLDAPLVGHGVYSYRASAAIIDSGEWDFQAWHAHNEFLQQWFSYGVIGVALSLLIYFMFSRVCRKSPSLVASLGLVLLAYSILHGLTDAHHIELSFPLSLMVVLWLQTNTPDRSCPA